MFVHSPKSQCIALLALAIFWLGLAAGYGQGTIVYGRLSNPYPPPSIPQPWDDSGYPVFSSFGGGLILDFNGDGQPDVGFNVYDTAFEIYGFGSTRVLTYPAAGFDINSFLPVLPAETEIGATPPSGSLIWRETLYLAPDGRPYSATYNGANNAGYGGYWQGVEGYTGVEFYIGDDPHYAWIRVGAPFVGLYGGYIYDYAYETVPNKPILAGEKPIYFEATFNGGNEVPPNKSTHSGTGTFILEGDVLSYNLTMDGSFRPTSAGIFGSANPCLNSSRLIANLGAYSISNFPPPTLIPLNHRSRPPSPVLPPFPGVLIYDGQITLSSNQVAELLAGQLYVNFKSAKFRQGELRGEILSTTPIQFSATLSSRNDIPHNKSMRHGEAAFTLTGNSLSYELALDNFTFTSAGIYTSPIVFPHPHNLIYKLDTSIGVMIPDGGLPNAPGLPGQVLYSGNLTLTDKQVSQIKRGDFSINVLTSRFRNGEIGGRILPNE